MATEFKKETTEQRDAFNRYYNMGLERSYSKIAMQIGKSITTVENWGRAFTWQDRVAKLDAEARNKETEKQIIEGEMDYRQRHQKMVKLAQFKHLEALKAGKIKYTMKSYIELMEFEHKLRTGYHDQVDININIKDMPKEELVKKIDELTESVKRLSDIPQYNPRDTITDADFIEIQTNENGRFGDE